MARSRIHLTDHRVAFLTEYAKQGGSAEDESLVIPEDLTGLSDEDLAALSDKAHTAFDALYPADGAEALSNDDLEALSSLTEGIEALNAEQASRDAAAAERREQAEELARRVRPPADDAEDAEKADDSEDDGEPQDAADGDEGAEDDKDKAEPADDADSGADGQEAPQADAEDEQPQAVAAAATPKRRETRVNLAGLRSRQSRTPAARQTGTPTSMRDIVMAGPDVPGFANGQSMDWDDMARAVDSRLTTFDARRYAAAARSGKSLRQQFSLATIRKPFAEGLTLSDAASPEQAERVLDYATDEKRLKGGSLVASGGWCAPSETMYDLVEIESRDGLFSLPEINIARGGIKYTTGPSFADLYANITGFAYTEEEDEAGDYDGEGGGSKPCYHIDCVEFVEKRLALDGLCITAGLLQRRGYPELIARVVRGAMVAHDHRLSATLLSSIEGDSTAVSLPANQVGALAPVLTGIELQVEHYRDTHRLARGASLEAVFPFWVRGAIRSDLSRRLGVDLIDVPDSRISAWFTERGVSPQFVYNWQGVSSTAASGFTSWPDSVKFLLYRAGTWTRGSSDVITMDTVYDSTLLGTNDYTALFTEEGWLLIKRGDSRVVTVPLCPDGSTGAGVAIDCDGTEAA